MNTKRILMILFFAFIVVYIAFIFFSNDSEKGKQQDIVNASDTKSEQSIIEPQEKVFEISNIDKALFASFSIQQEENYYYSNIELLETDINHNLLDINAIEQDTGADHIFVSDDNEMISISYLVGRSRILEDSEMVYLTYVNSFPTLCSIPEPKYPYNENYQGEKNQQVLDDYYESSVDYWDSLEYYQIDIELYCDADKYSGTLLLNTWDGKITYNDEYVNKNGIYMIVRGYIQGYNIENGEYFDAFSNPYVEGEDYGHYAAYFSDGKAVYCVRGMNNLQDFLKFLDLFGGNEK